MRGRKKGGLGRFHAALKWGLRHFLWRCVYWIGSIRARNNSMPARPNMARSSVFDRLIWASAWLLLHGSAMAFLTASMSRLNVRANCCRAWTPVARDAVHVICKIGAATALAGELEQWRPCTSAPSSCSAEPGLAGAGWFGISVRLRFLFGLRRGIRIVGIGCLVIMIRNFTGFRHLSPFHGYQANGRPSL